VTSYSHDPLLISKIRRAYKKAGMDASEEERTAFRDRLLELNVPVLSRGSRISKVLTGEKPIESLLEPSGGHVQHQPVQPLQLISAGAGVGGTLAKDRRRGLENETCYNQAANN
jgi:hypothetical protein